MCTFTRAQRFVENDGALTLQVGEECRLLAGFLGGSDGQHHRRRHIAHGAPRRWIKLSQRVDLIVEEFQTKRQGRIERIDIDDTAARAELPESIDLARRLVAKLDETRKKRLARERRTDFKAQAHALEISARYALLYGGGGVSEHDDRILLEQPAEYAHAQSRAFHALRRRFHRHHVYLGQFHEFARRQKSRQIRAPRLDRLAAVRDDDHGLLSGVAGGSEERVLL